MNQRDRVLKERIFGENETTESEVYKRVANFIGNSDDERAEFYRVMSKHLFLPNSPCLVNAGKVGSNGQLNACFVLDIEDNIESIFETLSKTAKIHKTGGGTGFNFSKIRPNGASIKGTKGTASGVISWMKIFDVTTEQIKQGGVRRGANMAVLRIDHPDIFDFIDCKNDQHKINNFNISVAITDKFIKAVKNKTKFELVFEDKVYQTVDANMLLDKILTSMHLNGEPGILFIDKINKEYLKTVGSDKYEKITAVNPCGETPLLPNENCCLGSINLSAIVDNAIDDTTKIEYLLIETCCTAIHFLNSVLDKTVYPFEVNREMAMKNRKIGIGVMGFADACIKMGYVYGSDESIEFAEFIMSNIQNSCRFYSDIYDYNNLILNAIAPTGQLSIIAKCNGGIEPLFSLIENVNRMETEFVQVAPIVKWYCEKHNVSLSDLYNNPLFVTSNNISYDKHLSIQEAFQKYTDNAVSKTINLPNSANVQDIRNIFFKAERKGLKGFTVYRDGSRDSQVLTENKDKSLCPSCGAKNELKGGCYTCTTCGFSICG